jgi:alpha-L-rhamnosidase
LVDVYLELTVESTATIYAPSENIDSITESGRPAPKAEAVHFLQMDKGRAVLAIDSGNYQFVSRLPNPGLVN